MIALDVFARSTQDKASFDVVYIVEELVSGDWKEMERIAVTAGSPQASRTFLIDPGRQRMKVEPLALGYVTVYDKEQMSNQQVPISSVHVVPEETEYSSQKVIS